jgi:hypothetical protein
VCSETYFSPLFFFHFQVESAGLDIVSVEEVAMVGQGTMGKGGEHGGSSTSDWEEVGEVEEGGGKDAVPLGVEGASEGEGASNVEGARGALETVGAGDVAGVLQQAAVAPVTAALEAAGSVDREVDADAGDTGEREADAADATDDDNGDGDDGDGDGGGCWEMPVYMIVGTKPFT